ncbi:hypothetical protein M7I_8209 [Glarea lozoyensis 74030]|uniref:Uncharacterized protein n=1 Tax=Glarea lozoyensis (strain ATCC 74030 / MF5533) TaxID=1104152 RepID=H0EZE4_GLAL7|nr:hypothetical protein M7I_8209 [Glarea lozoyensis 74030]
MNGVVVDLNEKTAKRDHHTPQSSLTHVSEKAIESYFHLFHLLLCLAAETPETTQKANQTINGFMAGANSKNDCPSLGYFLISALISDVEMTQEVLTAIVKETTIRNVVWVLDKKGTGNSELSYLEPSAVSKYRMRETFKASKTSYRILMFLNLFRRTAVGSPRKPLIQLRDEAFDRHGAPPRGSAKDLADSIKKIHDIDSFDGFFEEMGMAQPSPQELTSFLRQCIEDIKARRFSFVCSMRHELRSYRG